MKGIQPEKRTAYEKVPDFVATVVVDECAPILVTPAAGIFMFIECRPIKFGEGEVVVGEMPRHPIENHADVVLMTQVDQISKIIRAAITAGGGVIAGSLVTPGFVQRVLGNREQLNMRKAGFQHVGHQLIGQLPIGQPAPGTVMAPGARMHLIDRNRAPLPVEPVSALKPVSVAPGVLPPLGHHCGIGRPVLKGLPIRIGFGDVVAVSGCDGKLVKVSRLYSPNEYRPDTIIFVNRHGMTAAVPVVEVADHTHGLGVGCPNGKTGAFDSSLIPEVGTQNIIDMPVPAFGKQVQVELTQGGAFHRPQIPE